MKRTGDGWRSPLVMLILAWALTYIALFAVVVLVELLGTWGFWLSMWTAAIFPPWLRLRSRIS